MDMYQPPELQVIRQACQAGRSPAWVVDLMRGRRRPTNPKLISYQDEGEPDMEDCLPEEGVAIRFIKTHLKHRGKCYCYS